MATLVIKSFPEELHALLKKAAADNRRSVTQETIRLLEMVLTRGGDPRLADEGDSSYWANRKLLPEFEVALVDGAFSEGTDSADSLSEERDAR